MKIFLNSQKQKKKLTKFLQNESEASKETILTENEKTQIEAKFGLDKSKALDKNVKISTYELFCEHLDETNNKEFKNLK